MIKNTTVLATKRCNSRCTMCNIWKEDTKEQEMSVQQFRELFSREEFRELEDLNISGGEPTLREDIIEVIRAISENMPKLNMFFLSTNGTNPQKTRDIFQDLSGKIKDLHLCVSIDGDRETNKMVRGIDSYETALKTIEICKKTTPEIHTIISSTLTSKNCDEETLNHIKKIAEKTGSTFSFRMAWKNGTYYKNT